MTRREIRENVFKILFRIEFHDRETFLEQIDLMKEECENLKEEDFTYIKDKCVSIFEKKDEIDAAINSMTKGWKTTRMNKVDLSLIRLAVYEIKFEEDIPYKVSVNEVVELAKKYGTDESASFENSHVKKCIFSATGKQLH